MKKRGKKLFKKIPKYLQAKIESLNGRDFIVSVAMSISHADFARRKLKNFGLKSVNNLPLISIPDIKKWKVCN